ncbi:mechanosensitive ion channel family protein [Natronorubrum halalkaliphilum]|uniref:mechanosensitive ion channel family protein n=1 Tax=Natronorubrum halalkaliphilum TaxID=2691917 RepID=UPI002E2D3F48|nr:hypothetical protein [Natronorubrum halalkaliphilum]
MTLLTETIEAEFEAAIADLIAFLPSLIAAAVIVLLGLFIGSKLQPIVSRTGQRVSLDETVRQTPLESLFPDGPTAVSEGVGLLVKYYVVLIALVTAAHRLGFQFVGAWIESAVAYLPALAAGLAILLVGFLVADYAGTVVRRSEAARDSGFSAVLAGATKAFLYFVVAVIGLETMGVNVTILYTFAEAFALAGGLAVALAVGIAFGWAGKDYVAANLDDWAERSRDAASDSKAAPSDD